MSYHLSPIGNTQQMDANGDPLVSGRIYTYLAGSTTPAATYTDNTGATAQANYITLNSLGLPNSPIWLTGGIAYKFVITTSADVVLRTVDNISGINDSTGSQSEWVDSGYVPTYVSATSFTVPGDKTDTLLIGRRLRTTNTAGVLYSRISGSSFAAAVTTVTVVNDSTVLDAGLSAVSYGLASSANSSLPNSAAVRTAMGISTAIQSQTNTAYTTGGTSTAYTITPEPAITAYAAGQSWFVTFNAACGATPTFAVSGVGSPPNLVKQNPDGTYSNLAAGDAPINHRSRVTLLSATQAWVESLPRDGQELTSSAVQTTTSGTSVDFTGIPSWVKRVTINLSLVSTNGTSNPLFQIGPVAGIEATGYVGSGTSGGNAASPTVTNYTTGFGIPGAAAANSYVGTLVLTLLNSTTNLWVASGNLSLTNTQAYVLTSGAKSLAGPLERVRFTTLAGTDTFDAGSMSILWE